MKHAGQGCTCPQAGLNTFPPSQVVFIGIGCDRWQTPDGDGWWHAGAELDKTSKTYEDR